MLPPPPRPRVWTVFVAFIVAFALGGFVLPALVLIPIVIVRYGVEALNPDTGNLEQLFADPWVFLPTIASTQVGLIGVSLFAAAMSPVRFARRLRLTRPRLPWYGFPIIIAGTLALGLTSSRIIELLGLGDRGALKSFSDALAGLRGPGLILAALIVGLAPGFGEELLFRGYIQTRLTRRWGRFVSIFIASLLFAAIHMDWIQGAFVLLLGFYLGEIAERTGSIWPCIVCHAVNNTVSTLLVPLEGATGTMPCRPMSYTIIAGGLAVLGLATWYVVSRPLVPPEDLAPIAPSPPGFAVGAPIQWPPAPPLV
jgi:membrane protease YdiL (CAAX protease family)